MLNETPSAFLYKKIVIPATLSFLRAYIQNIYNVGNTGAHIHAGTIYSICMPYNSACVYISAQALYVYSEFWVRDGPRMEPM